MISRERLYVANKKGMRRARAYSLDFLDGDKVRVLVNGETVLMDKWEWRDLNAKKLRNTTKLCSRACCGNPRRYFGELTMQERRSDDVLKNYRDGNDVTYY